MTEQEPLFSNEQELSANSSEPIRFTLVAAVGIMGERDDCERFMKIMLADFQVRLDAANKKIFNNRITLLPLEETLEVQEPTRSPS